jgi:hypothetical protein
MNYRCIFLIAVLFGLLIIGPNGGVGTFCGATSDIELRISLDKQSYEVGEPIKAECEIRNASNSTIWLLPLPQFGVHFRLYMNEMEVLPFEKVHTSGITTEGFIVLPPDHGHSFTETLDKGGYKMPESGEYSLCINYENHYRSMDGYELWIGEVDSCVPMKIKEP